MSRVRLRHERGTAAILAAALLVLGGCGDGGGGGSEDDTATPSATPSSTAASTATSTRPDVPDLADLPPEPRTIFEWYGSGEDQKSIVVSDADLTTAPVRVVPATDGDEVHAAWSPDGSLIAWEVLEGDAASVWVAQADGSDPREVARCEDEPCVQMSWPTFTPDSASLLVTRYDLADDGSWGPSHLVLVDVEDGEQQVVASTADGLTSFYQSSMSPDATTIAASVESYTRSDQDQRTASEIVVVDTDPATDDEPTAITDAALFAGYPRWHPTDDRILFASWDLDAYQGDEPSQLYSVGPDGSGLEQITDVDHAVVTRRPGEANWTPDGERIIASIGIVQGRQVVDVKVAYVDPETGEIAESALSGAMPSLQP